MSKLITLAQIAEFMGVSEHRVRCMQREEHDFPEIVAQRHQKRLYRFDDIEQFIARRKISNQISNQLAVIFVTGVNQKSALMISHIKPAKLEMKI